MKKTLVIFSIILFFNIVSIAQSRGLSLKIGADYCQSKMVSEQLFGTTNVGEFASRYGFRLGLSYEQPIYKHFSITSDIGFSQGGFDNYKNQGSNKVNQVYFSITPQVHFANFFKIHAGPILNYNFKSQNNLSRYMETTNVGYNIGGALVLDRLDIGFQFIHYFNYYFDYKKLYSIATDEKGYWNILGIYMSYRFLGKNPNTLGGRRR